MTTVAFPSALANYLERDSVFSHNNNVKTDIMSDGTVRVREMASGQYVSIECNFKHLFSTDKDTLETFLKTNRANTITWTIDGVAYTGNLVGGHKLTMTGSLYNISFTYYATTA